MKFMTLTIKKNDTVKILSGKERAKTGRVLRIIPKNDSVVVEGLNLKKKHRRPRRQGEKGQTVQIPGPIHVSNVMLVCPACNKPNRPKKLIGQNGKKTRICRKCGVEMP